MLENPQRTKYSNDRFISHKNNLFPAFSTEYTQLENMDTE